jgi:hypothetical protein
MGRLLIDTLDDSRSYGFITTAVRTSNLTLFYFVQISKVYFLSGTQFEAHTFKRMAKAVN